MTDVDLLRKKLARIQTCVHELRTLGVPAQVGVDIQHTRFVEHTLQIAIQATIDVASHIVSAQKLGEPASNHDLFELLARRGWLPAQSVPTLSAMTGFRNVLVHEYDDVNPVIVRSILETRLGDLEAFVAVIVAKLLASPPSAS